MTPVDPGADPIEALREAVERIAAEPCAYLSDMDDLTCAVPSDTPHVATCGHGIYHHGCPSCDRQDPEERL